MIPVKVTYTHCFPTIRYSRCIGIRCPAAVFCLEKDCILPTNTVSKQNVSDTVTVKIVLCRNRFKVQNADTDLIHTGITATPCHSMGIIVPGIMQVNCVVGSIIPDTRYCMPRKVDHNRTTGIDLFLILFEGKTTIILCIDFLGIQHRNIVSSRFKKKFESVCPVFILNIVRLHCFSRKRIGTVVAVESSCTVTVSIVCGLVCLHKVTGTVTIGMFIPAIGYKRIIITVIVFDPVVINMPTPHTTVQSVTRRT